ncbi:tetratricopeptide repeat protein [Pseudooceanicola sp. LIPI14-2-Ac024]|uniref:tetratricopeptide repeat protein n=1 Tax=Pseudooceanicola sp. LIPI14-2-Ac024 TaxID=3344875 RepID=UPI0035CFC663
MPRTAASRSRGAEHWRARVAGAALLLAALNGPVWAFDDGQAAFDAGDYAAAATLWSEEAADGDAQAALNLGTLYDLGLGVPLDRARAFRFYGQAAEAGVPAAAFNVAVMLDAGIGTDANRAAAALWYARAAVRGQARAQYNLGLLYATGDGVPRNAEIAAYWLVLAGETLDAARQQLAALTVDPPAELTAPQPLGAFPVAQTGEVELVWNAAPGPEGSELAVQVARLAAAMPVDMRTRTAEGSAMVLPERGDGMAWRVLRIDRAAGRYAAGPWQGVGATDLPVTPRGAAHFLVSSGAEGLAQALDPFAGDLGRGGVAVRMDWSADRAAPGIRLAYGFETDALLAQEVAGYLPGLDPGAVSYRPDAGLAPGTLLIEIGGAVEAVAYSGR